MFMMRTLRGWLGHMQRTGLTRELFPTAWPLFLLALVVWSAGEMTGYGLGMGKAEQHVLGYDAHRVDHLSQRDRKLLESGD